MKKYQKKLVLLLIVSISCLESTNAQASSLIIDNFQDPSLEPQNVIIRNPNAAVSLPDGNVIPLRSIPTSQSELFDSILGKYRDLSLSTTTNPVGISRSNGQVLNGYVSLSNDTDVDGTLKVDWDGNDSAASLNPTGLYVDGKGVDLTLNGKLDGISVGVLSADLDFNLVVDLYTNENNYSRTNHVFKNGVRASSPIEHFFSFQKDFRTLQGQGADFANIGAIRIAFSGPKELDAKINLLEASKSPQANLDVSEPSVSWLFWAGLAIFPAISQNSHKNKHSS